MAGVKVMISGEEVEVIAVDLERGLVDWKRTTGGYLGVCTSEIGDTDFSSMETHITAALGADLKGQDNPLAK